MATGGTSEDILVHGPKPQPDVEHTLHVHQPFSERQLPAEYVVGLTCTMGVCYPELETFINQTLGEDMETMSKLSAALWLNKHVPQERPLASNMHLIAIDGDNVAQAVDQFVSELNTLSEPVRQRLSGIKVFLDEGSFHLT